MSSPGPTLHGSCQQQRSVRNASVPTVACGLGPCCSGSWVGPAAEKRAAVAVEAVDRLAVSSGVAAAVDGVAGGGCYCSLYSSRATIRYDW